MRKRQLPAGSKFNKLTVVEELSPTYSSSSIVRHFKCKCDCGNYTKVIMSDLLSNHTKSCGCLMAEVQQRIRTKLTHGECINRPGQKKNKSSKEYVAWVVMNRRCHNPSSNDYYLYGAKGDYVCQEWRDSFPQFLADMGRAPSASCWLRRKDKLRPFDKHNTIWWLTGVGPVDKKLEKLEKVE